MIRFGMDAKNPSVHNFPIRLTSFIGREAEEVEIKRLLSQARLLTLTGPGGCGKTSLALKVASGLLGDYPDGIWFVDLSENPDPSLVPQTVAFTLGLRKEPGISLPETLASYLQDRRLLLILDNCENLVEACARICQFLLPRCSHLQILATSRESIQLPGEVIWQVLPLSFPNAQELISSEELQHFEAVQLFMDRARYVFPSFSITEDNAADVVQVCRRLDGIPLAIELAAARVNVLSVTKIVERLDQGLWLLTGGSRVGPSRQQTLRATLDWSYELLSEKEKQLFQRLALFSGGFRLEAAETITSGNNLDEKEILDLLSLLVNKSFVSIEHVDSQERRYRLLEMVRQYCLEKLKASRDEERVQDLFLDYYLAMSEKAETGLGGPQQGEWIDLLEQEYPNFRTALQLSQANAVRIENGLRLAVNLTQFWQLRGYLSEGSRCLDQLLDRSSSELTVVKAKGMQNAGFLAQFLEDYDRAILYLEEARDMYEQLGDTLGFAYSISFLGSIFISLGDFESARTAEEKSLTLQREMNNSFGAAVALLGLGEIAYLQGDMGKAKSFYEESLDLSFQVENHWGAARRLVRLGQVSGALGNLRRSVELFEESFRLASKAGDKWGTAMALAGLAETAEKQGLPERSARLLGAVHTLIMFFATHLKVIDWTLYENCVEAVRAQLGEENYLALWSEGRSMTFAQTCEYLFAGPDRLDPTSILESEIVSSSPLTPLQAAKNKYGGLTSREREVAALVAQGKTNAAIAAELFVGVRTVEAHITRILTKLDFTSRTQIAGWAIDKGLAPPPRGP